MLESSYLSFFVLVNLSIYALISLPLDVITYTNRNRNIDRKGSPTEGIDTFDFITFFVTSYFWVIFGVVSINTFFDLDVFYNTDFDIFDPISTIIQVFGAILILLATFTACWGRITRGRRAISWGKPIKLETTGMFRFIRHPLYASYCYYFIGFILLLQSVLILPLIIGVPGYNNVAKDEEKTLIEYFGEEYIQYSKKTGRLFPRFR